jgi:hypothetical protein
LREEEVHVVRKSYEKSLLRNMQNCGNKVDQSMAGMPIGRIPHKKMCSSTKGKYMIEKI